MGRRKDRKQAMIDLALSQPPAQSHSATSIAAAEQIRPHVQTMRDRVLDALKTRPMTDQELATALGMDGSSVRPRRIELERANLVTSCGSRLTSSGRKARVWMATNYAYGRSPDYITPDDPA